MDVIKRFWQADKRAIAQMITAVENGDALEVLGTIFPHTGKAYYIGITGPPGAGKSTLVNNIAHSLVENGKKIGIIAVDPTSPFSGGALLGDRIRMTDLALKKDIFIRSMASRGSLGGLANKTKDVILVLDAAGMDYILIETIGVGQVELDIAQVCDTTVVVLVPESGDSIQAMKAGLLEIADIMCVNKGDREGSDRLLTELKFALDMREQKLGWDYPVIKTIATKGIGVQKLIHVIEKHQRYLNRSGQFVQRRKARLKKRINELIEEKIKRHLKQHIIKEDELASIVDKIYQRKLNPYQVATMITRKIIKTRR
jgi:LAO/AO transport system kinase